MTRLLSALLAFLLAASPALAGGTPATLYDVAGNPVGTAGNPLSVTASGSSGASTCTVSQTVVSGSSGTLIAANSVRKSLRWMNVGAADITVAPGATVPAAGQGMVYAAVGAGKQGGSESYADPVMATNAFAYSAASAATIAVWECQ